MLIEKIRYRKQELPFRHPFTISGGRSKTHQPIFQIALQANGVFGYGEAPEISYYGIRVEQMIRDLELIRPKLLDCSFAHPEELYRDLKVWLPQNSFLRCAIDMAAWDLYAKLEMKPVHALWGRTSEKELLSDYTIGIGAPEEMLNRMKEMPWPIYKIKLGFEEDMQLLAEIRKHTKAKIRVDVNAGWSLEQAERKFGEMEDLQIELVEQPLAKEEWGQAEKLFQFSRIPIFADESCVEEEDVLKCAGRFHGINIKLTKCGGITPALRMIQHARNLGLQVMMGSMNESSIGSAAIAQFIPQLDFMDADGPLLLAEDSAKGLRYNYGQVILSGGNGLGITLIDAFKD